MPKFNVMINLTRTIEESVEIEVSAKDEAAAQEKIEARVEKAQSSGKLDEVFAWSEDSTDYSIEYEVSEA